MVAFLSGAVLTASNLNSAFNALTIRAVTGTSDTFVLADNGGAVSYSNASAITATIPPNSSVAFAVGTTIQLLNLGAGVVTVTAGAGVTVNGSVLTLAQNTGGLCIKTATNTWYFLPSASASGLTLISEQSFTAVSAVNFTSLMSSAYRNYRLMFYSNNSGSTRIRLRSGATDDSAANYDATGSLTADAAVTSWRGLDSANCTINTIILDLLGPAIASVTGVSIMVYQSTPGTNQFSNVAMGQHRAASAFDGVSVILGGAGAFTGTAKLYGYGGA